MRARTIIFVAASILTIPCLLGSCYGEDTEKGMEINCSNGEDDDNDGQTDCHDQDCTAAPYCNIHCNRNGACDPGENENNCPDDC